MADARERPLLFSGSMVLRILADAKWQTRRILKPQPRGTPWLSSGADDGHAPGWFDVWEEGRASCGAAAREVVVPLKGLPWRPGDRAWVRETWADVNSSEGPALAYKANGAVVPWEVWCTKPGPDYGAGPSMNYDRYPGNYTMWASDLLDGAEGHAWRSPIHMPRWASRITLEITDVRVQRLQSISEEDAVAEGIEPFRSSGFYKSPAHSDGKWRAGDNAYLMFRDLWSDIYGPDAWDANPWVAALSFRRIKGDHHG